ncbi:UDP-N-acetylmuramate dehydrogenase [Thiohalorhabdus methylotrophus]|uniref:UDP-N-acetylenolpyruvoylglucosamine reductase n=1 Tax=Thiohalorhabdus methylotrophus TaxID=3242694 RepID=A0ABV4TXX6_9GAMM
MNASAADRRARVQFDAPMAPRTTWRVGGTADRLFAPRTLADLQEFLAGGEAVEPFLWMGHGSNLLVRDGGVAGTVICTRGGPKALERLDDTRVRAEAGVSSARVARFCADQGLAGAEFLAGIPGAVGGALAMNAGAYGSELADILEAAEVIDRQGRVRVADPAEFRFTYRHSRLPEGEWFVAAHIRLEPGDPEEIRARTQALLEHRGRTQPVHLANAGSVFRNPPGEHAARLVEAAGLKGTRVGGAEVSERHANFIINRGEATAADIEALIRLIQQRVAERFGMELEPEVRIVGREP